MSYDDTDQIVARASLLAISTSDEESVVEIDISALSFVFRGENVPVTVSSTVTAAEAQMALECHQFTSWVQRCEKAYANKQFQMHAVEIQSVDPFGRRGVGFVKINAHCTLTEGGTEHEQRLKGICFLKGDSVAVLVALHCEDGTVHSLLVEQPRVAIGQISALELPAGMLLDDDDDPKVAAVKHLEDECGLNVQTEELVDLTALACQEAADAGHVAYPGVAPSSGACDEIVRYFYVEKSVTQAQLESLQNKLIAATEFSQFLNLHVVPWEQVWKMSGDAKTMIALFLLTQLRNEGKVPEAGKLVSPLIESHCVASEKEKPEESTSQEPKIKAADGTLIPQLAFSLNLVPPTKAGEEIIESAIKAGYRHFDTSQFSRNEKTLGKVLKASGIPREKFYICSKVWNEAQKCGRFAVRKSVERSLKDLDFGDYFDLFMLHWPVPRYYVETYKELEELKNKGLIRSIGFRNFSEREYKMLIKQKITIPPAVAQIDVSPTMCPHSKVLYFQQKKVLVAASHALNRGKSFEEPVIMELANRHQVSPAQIMIRWAMQKGFIVVARSQKFIHMKENRRVCHFELTEQEMTSLDDLTDEAFLKKQNAREFMRKTSM